MSDTPQKPQGDSDDKPGVVGHNQRVLEKIQEINAAGQQSDQGDADDELVVTERNNRVLAMFVGGSVGLSMLVGAFFVYHFSFVRPGMTGYATVDISAAVRHREAQFTALLTSKTVNDRDREAAYRLVQGIGPEIEKAVATLQTECNCTILVKSAVVAGPALDLTPRLLQLMGIKVGAVQ